MIFEIAKLKVALKDYLEFDVQNRESVQFSLNDVCQYRFKLPSGSIKVLTDLSSKDLYDILICKDKIAINSLNYWRVKFPGLDFNFELMINRLFLCKSIYKKCLFFNWRIFHGQLFTENALHRMNLSDSICCLCSLGSEDTLHLLVNCASISYVWTQVEQLIKNIKGNDCEIMMFNKVFGYLDDSVESEICNIILSITRWLIWKRRCTFKKELDFMPQVKLFEWIQNDFKSHLKVLLKCNENDKMKNAILRIL